MPNPLEAADDFLTADLANLPDDTTYDVDYPVDDIAALHVQFAWDGTPSDADNREDAAVRFTVWAPRGQVTDPANVAAGLRDRLLLWSSEDVQRVSRGSGRIVGKDSDSDLPFCSFTVGFAMRATTPAS